MLYRERDGSEAEYFLGNVLARLQPPPGARMLDQACGRGRHALALSRMGFDVTGTDLSERNIAHCREMAGPNLRFFVHDMREPFRPGSFDCVFNIFTSMGYFASDREQQRVVCGALEIDTERHQVSVAGRGVPLTPIEYAVLAELARNAGRVLTTRMLLQRVWGDQYVDATEYVKGIMRRLRVKLEPDPAHPRYLLTERHLGYRLNDLVPDEAAEA